MLPSKKWTLTDDTVVYQSESGWKAQFKRRYTKDNPRPREVMHSIQPTLIVDSLMNTDLPEPGRDNSRTQASNPMMFLRPSISRAAHHKADMEGCQGVVLGLRETHYRELVVPVSCVREQFARPRPRKLSSHKTQGESTPGTRRWGTICWPIPQPFLISNKWPSKKFKPAMALFEGKMQAGMYYRSCPRTICRQR